LPTIDWSFELWPIGLDCDARQALGIMAGETYRQPQAASYKLQAVDIQEYPGMKNLERNKLL
jgi:hypothetical protein